MKVVSTEQATYVCVAVDLNANILNVVLSSHVKVRPHVTPDVASEVSVIPPICTRRRVEPVVPVGKYEVVVAAVGGSSNKALATVPQAKVQIVDLNGTVGATTDRPTNNSSATRDGLQLWHPDNSSTV